MSLLVHLIFLDYYPHHHHLLDERDIVVTVVFGVVVFVVVVAMFVHVGLDLQGFTKLNNVRSPQGNTTHKHIIVYIYIRNKSKMQFSC